MSCSGGPDSLHDRAATERSARRKLERHLRVADAELALAQVIQESLVSPDIEQHDLTVVLRQIPCSYVGGDYLQAMLPRPDLLYLCVGGVAGHGVPAALVVSRIHGLVQRMIVGEVRPGPFLDSLHRSMLDLLEHTILFATFAVLRIDLAACSIEYATAGHPPQLLLHSGQAVEELMTPNCALGMELTALSPKILVGKYDLRDRRHPAPVHRRSVRGPGARNARNRSQAPPIEPGMPPGNPGATRTLGIASCSSETSRSSSSPLRRRESESGEA